MKEKEYRKIIKENNKNPLREGRVGLCESLIPYVSQKEMRDIEERYGPPVEYNEKDFQDMADWVMKAKIHKRSILT